LYKLVINLSMSSKVHQTNDHNTNNQGGFMLLYHAGQMFYIQEVLISE